MAFTSAGQKAVIIKDCDFAEARFAEQDPDAFDIILLLVEEGTGESDWWRGEISSRYGVGTFAGIKQMDKTIQDLEKVGWKHGKDLSKLDTLIGVKTEVGVKARTFNDKNTGEEKTVYDAKYLGPSSFRPKILSNEESLARMKRLFGAEAEQKPAASGAESPITPDTDPFA